MARDGAERDSVPLAPRDLVVHPTDALSLPGGVVAVGDGDVAASTCLRCALGCCANGPPEALVG
jgi:hypothetical protein